MESNGNRDFSAEEVGGKWGYVGEDGAWVIEPRFEEAEDFSEDFGLVKSGGKWGYIDQRGAWVIEPRFKGASDFLDGRAWVADDSSKWGCIDRSGEWMIEPRFDYVWEWNHDEGITHVRVGAKRGLINKEGQWIVEPTFDDLTWFHGGMALALVDRKWGVIDTSGAWIIKSEWYFVEITDDMRLRAREGGLDSEWRYFDRTGKEIDGAT